MGDIPPFPRVVDRLVERVKDPHATMTELAEIISVDPALSAYVLRMANSPLYRRGYAAAVTLTVSRALHILGRRALESVVLSYALKSLLRPSSLVESLLWEHCVAVAVAASEIIRRVHSKQMETAYVCGLLHDVGKVILNARFPDPMRAIIQDQYNDNWEPGNQPSVVLEKDRMGVDHCQVGAVALDVWQCGEEAVLSCAYHHRPRDAARRSILPTVVRMADLVAQKLEYGPVRRPELDLSAVQRAIKAADKDFTALLEGVQARVQEVLQLFGDP
ncbi:HDIG domain-containing protein [Desulfacinum hydrothermale DSM 13146]|uniref:HDIG domain-containing protein n=1 Tax=Desulfacinum hydrothermale DSM 13146 TaxID=1121390 RepID=A0A1W1X069_9BACT|nr:HDIG domain-containing protein [Desulfacinum hydrothermale DSM 13146]